jgi:hypothetical protein
VLQTLVSYRLIAPDSEWRLHREWFDQSAMADLLGADYRLAADDTLYRCLDKLPVSYLVGTPKGRLSKREAALAQRPWHEVREGIPVKLLPQDGECYVFAQSAARIDKERAMRRRQLKQLWKRLPELRQMKTLDRDGLLMKLGAARQQWPTAWRLVALRVPKKEEPINEQTFTWRLRKKKLRQVRRREGRYRLRTNLTEEDPAKLWQYYIPLTQVEGCI